MSQPTSNSTLRNARIIGSGMAVPDRVVPNIVGVDVGCGMAATNLGDELPLADAERS